MTSYVLLELGVGLLDVLLLHCSEGRECGTKLDPFVVSLCVEKEEEFRVVAVDMV